MKLRRKNGDELALGAPELPAGRGGVTPQPKLLDARIAERFSGLVGEPPPRDVNDPRFSKLLSRVAETDGASVRAALALALADASRDTP